MSSDAKACSFNESCQEVKRWLIYISEIDSKYGFLHIDESDVVASCELGFSITEQIYAGKIYGIYHCSLIRLLELIDEMDSVTEIMTS